MSKQNTLEGVLRASATREPAAEIAKRSISRSKL